LNDVKFLQQVTDLKFRNLSQLTKAIIVSLFSLSSCCQHQDNTTAPLLV